MIKPVYVTGLGVITPFGLGCQPLWQAMLEKRSALSAITRFDTSWLPVHQAVWLGVDTWQEQDAPEGVETPVSRLAWQASRAALKEAGLLTPSGHAADEETALFFSSTLGELHHYHQAYAALTDEEEQTAAFLQALRTEPPTHGPMLAVARALNLTGLHSMNINACASSGYALALGMEHIRQGHGRRALCGGADYISLAQFAGFCSLRSLSPAGCRPFDLHRDGLALGEAGVMILLESEEALLERGAKTVAQLLGYGWATDGYHMSAPHPQGLGLKRALHAALEDAGLTPDAIDFIVAHGTGTPSNDAVEARVYHDFFNGRAPLVTAPKGLLGHTMGAASALEVLVGILGLHHGVIPPTANFHTPDPQCPVTIVEHPVARPELTTFMANTLGFGGNTASLIVKHPFRELR